MFGTFYFGQSVFGQIESESVTIHADGCGGTFGSITLGSPVFGQLIDCGDVPPTPPEPVPQPIVTRRRGGGNPFESSRLPTLNEAIRKREMEDAAQAPIDDEEEIAIILSTWLSIK